LATQKPQLLNNTWANIVNDINPINPEYGEIIDDPRPSGKTELGWLLGEKPRHQYFNWNWKKIDEYIHHTNLYGIPKWDDTTVYEKGSTVIRRPFIYQALSDGVTGNKPEETPTEWKIIGQTLENLDDTDFSGGISNGDVIVYNDTSSTWKPESLLNILDNTGLESLYDVNITNLQIDNVITYNDESGYWENKTPDEVVQMGKSSKLTHVSDVQRDNLNENDVLKYYGNDTSGVWKTSNNIIDSASWEKIINKPDEFQPPIATNTTFGGAQIYSLGNTIYMYTIPTEPPSAPSDLVALSDPSKIELFWSPGEDGGLGYYYTMYRNGSKVGTGVIDVMYTDNAVIKDREYVYYVTANNQHGQSKPSNTVTAHTYTQPSAPRNLDHNLFMNNVNLFWEQPSIISGDLTYEIYRDNTKIGESNTLNYTDENVAVGAYTYYVIAKNKYYSSNNSNSIVVIIQ